MTSFSTLNASSGLLHASSLPSLLPKLLNLDHGLGMLAVSRSKFHAYILERAEAAGVEIHWGKRVVDVVQRENSTGTDKDAEAKVKVVFEDGTSDEASWVIGCDGLHSGVRIALFGKETADYTGVSQVCCVVFGIHGVASRLDTDRPSASVDGWDIAHTSSTRQISDDGELLWPRSPLDRVSDLEYTHVLGVSLHGCYL